LTVRAAVEQRPECIRQALLADPATAAQLPADQIFALAAAMVAAHSDLLPVGLR
jgi:alpha-galactosidase